MAILRDLTRSDRGLDHIADDAPFLLAALRFGSDWKLERLSRAPVAPDARLHLLGCQAKASETCDVETGEAGWAGGGDAAHR